MAFIHDNDLVQLNIRLTDKGREQLAKGRLKFSKFALGDSEIDYNLIKQKKEYLNESDDISIRVLRPVDLNPQITSFIKNNQNSDIKTEINGIPSDRTVVNNNTDEIGCFGVDNGIIIIKDTYVTIGEKQVGFKRGVVDITSINDANVTVNPSGIINPGDILLLTETGINVIPDSPKPHLFFYAIQVNGDTITLDRSLSPTYNVFKFVVFREIEDHYSVDYLFKNNVTALLNNFDYCDMNVFPYWKMSIIMLHNMPGTNAFPDNQDGTDKSFLEFETTQMGGFVNYIQKEKEKKEMLGVIHYTNPSPSNIYAEGLHETTPIIHIPTIMWEKGPGSEMGLKLYCFNEKKQLDEITNPLNISYHDLYDGELDENDKPINVVGKVFNGLKIIIIEDQDLIMAMNYKANRSWTLPEPVIFESGTGSVGTTPEPTTTTTTEEPTTTTTTEEPTTTTTTEEPTTTTTTILGDYNVNFDSAIYIDGEDEIDITEYVNYTGDLTFMFGGVIVLDYELDSAITGDILRWDYRDGEQTEWDEEDYVSIESEPHEIPSGPPNDIDVRLVLQNVVLPTTTPEPTTTTTTEESEP